MSARYVHNYAAFDREVLTSPEMRGAMRTRAERVKDQFVATAPVGEPYESDDHPGRFRDSAEVSDGVTVIQVGERAYGRVTVNDPDAMSIEFGHHAATKDGTPGRYVEGAHTLTRAVDAARDV